MDLGLEGRRVLITGSYRGTGAGIAAVMATEGAEVVVHGFEAGQPDEVVAAITANGGSATGVVADIANDGGIDVLSSVAGDVDVLVNNYGAPQGSDWHSMDKWDDAWEHNVMIGARVAQACMPAMRERGWGRIVFLGTVGTERPSARNPAYYSAKTALPVVVRTLAMDLRGTGVTANLVSPGMIATTEVQAMIARWAARDGVEGDWPVVERWALDNSFPNLTERIPEPVDIGRIVAFVASEAAWHLNGANIAVDGGAIDAG